MKSNYFIKFDIKIQIYIFSCAQILNKTIQMKKFFPVILGVLLVSVFSFNKIRALELTDFTPVLDKKVASMKTTEEKVKWLQKYADLLATPKFTHSKDAKLYEKLRLYTLNMLNVFQHELKEEQTKATIKKQTKNTTTTTKNTSQTTTSSIKNLPHISDNISNINVQKVRDAVLTWHNEERISI